MSKKKNIPLIDDAFKDEMTNGQKQAVYIDMNRLVNIKVKRICADAMCSAIVHGRGSKTKEFRGKTISTRTFCLIGGIDKLRELAKKTTNKITAADCREGIVILQEKIDYNRRKYYRLNKKGRLNEKK